MGAVERLAILRPLIETRAAGALLDPDLVAAVVLQESQADQTAWNPEPKYRYFWDVKTHVAFRAVSSAEVASKFPPKDFPTLAGDPDQEWWGQQASWGLMQIMGAVAREHGYTAPFLTGLVADPGRNLDLGCAHLWQLMRWAEGLTPDRALSRRCALAAYNGGKRGNAPAAVPLALRNGEYARQVLVRYDALRGV